MASDYLFGIFKLFLLPKTKSKRNQKIGQHKGDLHSYLIYYQISPCDQTLLPCSYFMNHMFHADQLLQGSVNICIF